MYSFLGSRLAAALLGLFAIGLSYGEGLSAELTALPTDRPMSPAKATSAAVRPEDGLDGLVLP
jgi:hypothetical protein